MDQDEYNKRVVEIATSPPMNQAKMIHDLSLETKPVWTKRTIERDVKQQAKTARHIQTEDAAKEALETALQNMFVLQSQSKVRVGMMQTSSINGHTREQLGLYSEADIRLLTANKPKVGDETLYEAFKHHPDRQDYNGIVIDPSTDEKKVDGKLNMWKGFSVKPEKGPVYLFLRHIMILSGWVPGLTPQERKAVRLSANYILDWLAWVIQNPGKPVGVMLTLIGEQGTGKGTLGNMLLSIFGQHGTRAGTKDSLVGKHCAHLLGACFVLVDEPPFAGDKAAADTLKGMITEPLLAVEPKFQDRFEVDNMLSFMTLTNHQWALHVEFSDRRNAVFEVPLTKKGKTAYWAQVQGRFTSKEGKAAVLYYLQNRDVSQWSAENDRPKTPIYFQQKLQSLDPVMRFWRRVVQAGTFAVIRDDEGADPSLGRIDNFDNEVDPGWCTKTEVYDIYYKWHQSNRIGGQPVDDMMFWKTTKRWLPELMEKNSPSNAGLKRARIVFLPDWDTLARVFDDWVLDAQVQSSDPFLHPPKEF
ncbi:primase-helicase family protein [Ruegeria arenilitoris]|uniref:primase-helicase family protein n=1 Tax=Ruegeria arenilitoris TaxID=1173585 RepID=UPI003464AFF5